MYINKSLCFLEQVVVALADRRRDHVPFRQSKLTACLKDSIGGNCNTRLIANVWAEAAQIEETVSARFLSSPYPSVLRHCWLGSRKGTRPVKNFNGPNNLYSHGRPARWDFPRWQPAT